MKFNRITTNLSLPWQVYKELELIPNSTPNPKDIEPVFTFGASRFWRVLISLLIQELVDEQRIEYLERCWAVNDFKNVDSRKSLLWLLKN